jgi:S1-C subfamily serine protease
MRSATYRSFIFVFLSGLLTGILLITTMFVFPYRSVLIAQTAPTLAPTPPLPSEAVYAQLDAMDQVLSALYERVSPSVVHITSQTETVDIFYGVIPSQGTGSGFILDKDGHILTNYHVVADATQVEVLFANGASYPAQVVGSDQYYDLAVLKIDVPSEMLVPVDTGDSSVLKVGQTVIAIGNPFGLDRTLTSGLISALGRRVETEAGGVIGQAIQTDAAINPGNSGGPLLDTRGHVIGINTAINSPSGGSVGIGFAVPINVAKRVVPQLIAKGRYAHPSLGIVVLELGTQVNAPENGPAKGLLIAQFDPDSAAQQAGLLAAEITRQRRRFVVTGGDIITAINGKPVETQNDLLLVLEENFTPGETVTVTVWRDGNSVDIPVKLGER